LTQKSISLQRIEQIGRAIERYNLVNGRMPERLADLIPHYLTQPALKDPWGNVYKYIPRPERYLVVGFTPDGKADTDLFLSRPIDIGLSTPAQTTRPDSGGIQLID
jgi:hypothetical protein